MRTPRPEMRERLRASVGTSVPGVSAADSLCSECADLFDLDGAAVSVVIDGASTGTFGASSRASRDLDEHQFTLGEGPCLDAVATQRAILVPDLDSPLEQRWPLFSEALLDHGIRGVFAMPILVMSECIGALDLFRRSPGPLAAGDLAGARLAAELAAETMLRLIDRAGPEMGAPSTGQDSYDPGDSAALLLDTDRVEVYQATGILISALGVDADEALVRLRGHAIASGLAASQVARDIIAGRLRLDKDRPNGSGSDGGSGESGGYPP